MAALINTITETARLDPPCPFTLVCAPSEVFRGVSKQSLANDLYDRYDRFVSLKTSSGGRDNECDARPPSVSQAAVGWPWHGGDHVKFHSPSGEPPLLLNRISPS